MVDMVVFQMLEFTHKIEIVRADINKMTRCLQHLTGKFVHLRCSFYDFRLLPADPAFGPIYSKLQPCPQLPYDTPLKKMQRSSRK